MSSSRTESLPTGRDPIEGAPPDGAPPDGDDPPLQRRAGPSKRPARAAARVPTRATSGRADDTPEPRAPAVSSADAAPDGQVAARPRVHIVRHVSAWSVFKVGLLWYLCLWVVVMVASVVLWRVADETGLLSNAQSFWAEATGQESVEWDGEAIFRVAAIAGGVFAVAATGFTVLGAVLFNGLCDLTGGIRLRVLDVVGPRPADDAAAPSKGRRRRRRRR